MLISLSSFSVFPSKTLIFDERSSLIVFISFSTAFFHARAALYFSSKDLYWSWRASSSSFNYSFSLARPISIFSKFLSAFDLEAVSENEETPSPKVSLAFFNFCFNVSIFYALPFHPESSFKSSSTVFPFPTSHSITIRALSTSPFRISFSAHSFIILDS